MGRKTEAELNTALSLINGDSSASRSLKEKFHLDAVVMSEGSNFSAGEKQLCESYLRNLVKLADVSVALLRALVRGCKVLLLDEATSSVDPETDALIQRIIQTEFSNVTVSNTQPAPDTRLIQAHLDCPSTSDCRILRPNPRPRCRTSSRGLRSCTLGSKLTVV